jgi:hypothetical protein
MTELNEYSFRYLSRPEQNIAFSEIECQCGFIPCLDTTWFNQPDLPESVCIDDLVSGKVHVEIPQWIVEELRTSVKTYHPEWNESEIDHDVILKTDELSRTPPVCWLQSNEWPIRNGDYCRYLGEWRLEKWVELYPDVKIDELVWGLLDQKSRMAWKLKEHFHESLLSGWTVTFVFQDISTSDIVVIDQSY